MTKKLTLHITDALEPIVDEFKLKKGNLSELLREKLLEWKRVEDEKGEFELITLDMEGELDKKFYGVWLWTDEDGPEVNSGVAATKGGRFLTYWRHGQGGSGYRVYDRVEDIEDDELRHKAEAILGDGAEFLDI